MLSEGQCCDTPQEEATYVRISKKQFGRFDPEKERIFMDSLLAIEKLSSTTRPCGDKNLKLFYK